MGGRWYADTVEGGPDWGLRASQPSYSRPAANPSSQCLSPQRCLLMAHSDIRGSGAMSASDPKWTLTASRFAVSRLRRDAFAFLS